MEGMGGGQSKNTPLKGMFKNFKRVFNGNYGVKLTPDKHRTCCEIEWPALGIGWPSYVSLDKVLVKRVFKVVVGEPECPN
jgi:hypothetical protein